MAETIVIDLQKAAGLTGSFLPFLEVVTEDVPDPEPVDGPAWQDWAGAFLAGVAQAERWQAGRYAFTVQRRDEEGRPLEDLTRGQWEWTPATDPS